MIRGQEQLDIFLDAGGTLVDTAASYGRRQRSDRHPPARAWIARTSSGLQAEVRTWRTGKRSLGG